MRKAKIRLDKGLAPQYSEVSQGGPNVTKNVTKVRSTPRWEGGDPTSDSHHLARKDARSHPRGGGPGHRRHRASPREGGPHPQPAGRAGDHAPEGPVQAAGPRYGRRAARHDVTPNGAAALHKSAVEGLRRGMHSESVPGLHGRPSGLSIPLRIGQSRGPGFSRPSTSAWVSVWRRGLKAHAGRSRCARRTGHPAAVAALRSRGPRLRPRSWSPSQSKDSGTRYGAPSAEALATQTSTSWVSRCSVSRRR